MATTEHRHTAHYAAIAQSLADNNPTLVSQYSQYAKGCLKPGINYFYEALNGPLQSCIKAFQAARLFSPSKVHEINPSANEVDSLKAFPFFNDISMIGLKEELPTYLSKAIDVSADYDPIQWWSNHSQELPRWSDAVQKVFLVQPSSAGAERAFSLLSNSFGDQQQNCLEDYIEASLMLQYNKS